MRERVTGANAAEHMWDDSMGSGLQVALFDAVARTNDVPVSARLLGKQVRERAFPELVGRRYARGGLGPRM
jgi:hypothetical protein